MSDFLLDIVTSQNDYLCHHGIKGQKWGERRYQNPDGSLTDAGRLRYYGNNGRLNAEGRKALKKTRKNLRDLEDKVAETKYNQQKHLNTLKKDEKLLNKGKEAKNLNKDLYVQSQMEQEFAKAYSNYLKYEKYAMDTFGDKKIKQLKYASNGDIMARRNNSAANGAMFATTLMAGPLAGVAAGVLTQAMEANRDYRKSKKRYEKEYDEYSSMVKPKKNEVLTVVKL